jgi:hypothetical protein
MVPDTAPEKTEATPSALGDLGDGEKPLYV